MKNKEEQSYVLNFNIKLLGTAHSTSNGQEGVVMKLQCRDVSVEASRFTTEMFWPSLPGYLPRLNKKVKKYGRNPPPQHILFIVSRLILKYVWDAAWDHPTTNAKSGSGILYSFTAFQSILFRSKTLDPNTFSDR